MRNGLLRDGGRACRGFSLTELTVVAIIIGILVSIGIPQYTKTVETAKATDAAAMLHQIAGANRMFALDQAGRYAGGLINTACNSYGCPSSCNAASPSSCCLIGCKYLPSQDWSSKPYEFRAVASATTGCTGSWSSCSGAALGPNFTACVSRKTSGAGSTTIAPYTNWGYAMDRNGIAACKGTDVPPPPS